MDRFTLWLVGPNLTGGLLAENVRYLHQESKPPSAISVAEATVNWVANYAILSPVAVTATGEALKASQRKDAENCPKGIVPRRGQVASLTRKMLAKVCGAVVRTARFGSNPANEHFLLRMSEAVAVDVTVISDIEKTSSKLKADKNMKKRICGLLKVLAVLGLMATLSFQTVFLYGIDRSLDGLTEVTKELGFALRVLAAASLEIRNG